MSNYHDAWAHAKATFEQATGLNKPAPRGKVPVFNIAYRKSTHVDAHLRNIDKLLPADQTQPCKPRIMAKLEKEVQGLARSIPEYVRFLDQSILQEKTAGKLDSQIYRDLKLLKSTLTGISAKVTLAVTKQRLTNEHAGKAQVEVFKAVQTAALSLESSSRDGIRWGQELLKAPDAHAFNHGRKGGASGRAFGVSDVARNITQGLAQFRKWAMPGEVHSKTNQLKRTATLEADTSGLLNEPIDHMVHMIGRQGLREPILTLLKKTGTRSVFDASLQDLGDGSNPIRIPKDASPADVTRATKHFMSLAKAALEISARMKSLENEGRLRIPELHKEEVELEVPVRSPRGRGPLPSLPAPKATPRVRPQVPAPLPPGRARAGKRGQLPPLNRPLGQAPKPPLTRPDGLRKPLPRKPPPK